MENKSTSEKLQDSPSEPVPLKREGGGIKTGIIGGAGYTGGETPIP